jgi:hypothetical protein
MASISSTKTLDSYALFNATDVKSYIINELSKSDNPVFSGCSYMGSNMNALIDIISLISQQILFHFSLNTAEASFTTTSLYENMSKLVNILNYKPIGKQTSMIPVRFSINLNGMRLGEQQYITIPRFTRVAYNSNYYLKNEIVIPIKAAGADEQGIKTIDTVLFEGEMRESSIFESNGDEFETFTINDNFINNSKRFITDNFFVVYVDEDGTGNWKEYEETSSLYLHNGLDAVYERRFNEDMNYEFKFGNGVNGKKFNKGARIVIFYLLSNGEEAILGDGIIQNATPQQYSSSMWASCRGSNVVLSNVQDLYNNTTVQNTGGGTSISYPESIESIRVNAPRVFASQNRLFTLGDYKTFIQKNFSQYVKDTHVCINDYYVNNYLKYFFDIGLDSPQEDSRLNIAQVEFMTTTNFNNVYAFIVPKVNTIIGGKIPNYLNNTLKREIVDATVDYKGLTHNVVLLDPIYKAITFGYFMDDSDWNANQLENRLVIVRGRLSKYSQNFIKERVVNTLKSYFNSLTLGSEINLAKITQLILSVPGVSNFYIKNNQGQIENKMTLFVWNPLYINEDNVTTQQSIANEKFVYPYFYDLDNIGKLIDIEDE